jgi:hypothetical protein
MERIGCVRCEKFRRNFILANLSVQPILHRLSCSKKMVQNALKHEFWVKWSGSTAFVAKNSDATLFSEFVW